LEAQQKATLDFGARETGCTRHLLPEKTSYFEFHLSNGMPNHRMKPSTASLGSIAYFLGHRVVTEKLDIIPKSQLIDG